MTSIDHLSLLFLAALDADRLAWSFASARICLGALATNRQTTAMPQATVRADLHQALDAGIHLAAQVAFDAIVALHDFTQTSRIGLAQVAHTRVRVDARHF